MASAGIVTHFRNYASAGMLSALAGLISFPILTRNLSVEDYGILGLITASLTLCVAFGKLGVQHAVIRFYAQVRHGNIAFSRGQLNATISIVFLLLGLVATVLWIGAGYAVLPRFMQYEGIPALFLVSSGVVFVRLVGSSFVNLLRAEQRSGVVSLAQVIARYLNLLLVVALLLFSSLSPAHVLLCLLVSELVMLGINAWYYRDALHIEPGAFSTPLVRQMLLYGMPLMILESLGLILRLSDRYLIEAMLGVEDLGMYSASYNLTGYLELIVLSGLVQAIKPMYVSLWESEGRQATVDFLSRGYHLYLLLGLPVVAMFSLCGPHLLNFLASDKYAPGTVIIPFVAFSFLLDGSLHFLGAGLYIHKNTKVLMTWGLIATLLNIALNIAVIPVHGILGAAAVTIVSYAVFMVGVTLRSFRVVPFPVSLREPAWMAVVCLVTYLLLDRLPFPNEWLALLVKGVAGGIVFGVAVLVLDADIRRLLHGQWQRLSGMAR